MKRIFISALLVFILAACGWAMPQGEATEVASWATPEIKEEPMPRSTFDELVKTLVAYFSRAGENYGVGVVERGSTEIIAEMIAEAADADTFHIQTVKVYPESYEACKEVVTRERNAGERPALASTVANFDDYDVIYLGYPIWYGDMPMAVYSFLESYDFTGKTIIPFCTHEGSGLAGTVRSIQSACSGATVWNGLAIAGTMAQNDRETAKALVEDFLQIK